MTSTAWNTIETLNAKIRELEARLQRYSGAVECEGMLQYFGSYGWSVVGLNANLSDLGVDRRVRVLVMKEEA